MCRKRFGIVLLSCVLMLSSVMMSVSAAELPNNGNGAVVMRAAGRLDSSIPAKTLAPINVAFSLEKEKLSSTMRQLSSQLVIG